MEETLLITLLNYLNTNNVNHNPVDIISPFADLLTTLDKRMDFVRVIKELKSNEFIKVGGSFVLLGAAGPPNGTVLQPLESLDVKAAITIKGQQYLADLDKPAFYNIQNSQNTIIGSNNAQSFRKSHLVTTVPTPTPNQNNDHSKGKGTNMGFRYWGWVIITTVIAGVVVWYITTHLLK